MCVNGNPCWCCSDICIIHYITSIPTLRTKLTLTNVINPYTKQATDLNCSVYIYLRYISCKCSALGHSVHYAPHREVISPSTETAAFVDSHVPVISTIASNRLDLGGHASRSCWWYWPQIKVQSVQTKPRWPPTLSQFIAVWYRIGGDINTASEGVCRHSSREYLYTGSPQM